ncbi:MAG: hypothetical protein SH850_06480 [Planctomycetaceae bacterium]|nr:hypothetical protein [Planctomycetaceae bacterium]
MPMPRPTVASSTIIATSVALSLYAGLLGLMASIAGWFVGPHILVGGALFLSYAIGVFWLTSCIYDDRGSEVRWWGFAWGCAGLFFIAGAVVDVLRQTSGVSSPYDWGPLVIVGILQIANFSGYVWLPPDSTPPRRNVAD